MAAPTNAQLNTEITTDPKALGYAAFVTSGDDTGLALKLNSTYAGVSTVYRSDLSAADVMKSLVWTDLVPKGQKDIEVLQMLMQPKSIDASQTNIRNMFIGLFPSGSTLTNLTAVASVVNPTRAEELWGSGTVIHPIDVAHALGR